MSSSMDFYLEIAKKHYPAMEKYAIELSVFQINYEKCTNFHVKLEDSMTLLKASQLSSWWLQIYSQYHFINRCLIEALGYYDISDTFTEETKKYGMLHNFQYCVEHFIFRLFALLEKIAQLSNVYHSLEIKVDKLSFNKVMEKWKTENLNDDFVKSVIKFSNVESVKELKSIRQHLTHKLELDLVGIGFPYAYPVKDKSGNITGLSYGGYKLAKPAEQVRIYIIDTFNNLTDMLKEIDYLLEKGYQAESCKNVS